MLPSKTLTVISHSAAETYALGLRLGGALSAGQVVTLRGDLGAGKTTLAQGIVCGLGSAERATSPTFTLVNEYWGRSGLRILHVDLYRLGETPEREAETSGLGELFDDPHAVILVEWPERIAGLLPQDLLEIALFADVNHESLRRIECRAYGLWSQRTLETCTVV